jgi:hypothetical protein
MALELLKGLQLGIGAEPALDLLDHPTCKVSFRSHEQCLVAQLESFWDFEMLVIRLLLLLHHFFFHTPLDPNKLLIRSFNHSPLLDTRSQQGLVANPLRIRDCEPCRFTSHPLGSIADFFLLGSWPQACGGS